MEVQQVLNERLAGLTLGEIKNSISERMSDVTNQGRLVKLIINSKDKIWTEHNAEDINIVGADKLVRQPEFSDLMKVSQLVKIIEDGSTLTDFFSNIINDGLVITIGAENKLNEIINCSMVTSNYKIGNVTGTIGIVGPTRMEYDKLVSIVDYTAKTITEVLSGIDNN
jgi:heat-inducible transcriptional repressor